MKRKLLMIVLCVAMIAGLMPVTASAAKKYSIWVSGIQVTDANKNDIIFDGSAKYDPDTDTLTLNNYQASAIKAYQVLNIDLTGRNVISTMTSQEYGIYTLGDCNIKGTGSLDIIADSADLQCGIGSDGNVVIKNDGKLYIDATGKGIYSAAIIWIRTGGTIRSVQEAVRGRSIFINSGDKYLKIEAGREGLYSNNGNIEISGSTDLSIESTRSCFNVYGGDVIITANAHVSAQSSEQYALCLNSEGMYLYLDGKEKVYLRSKNGLPAVYNSKNGSSPVTGTNIDNYYAENGAPNHSIVLYRTGVRVTGVSLNNTSLTINKGLSVEMAAFVSPANATNKNVTWSSSDSSVVSIASDGTLTAVNGGSAYITATTADGGYKASCSVTVRTYESNVPATGISLDRSYMTLTCGESWQLNANVLPSDASNKNIYWYSSEPDIVSVSSHGLVTAIGGGTAVITAMTYDGHFEAECTVVVYNYLAFEIDGSIYPLSKARNDISGNGWSWNAARKELTLSGYNGGYIYFDTEDDHTIILAEGTKNRVRRSGNDSGSAIFSEGRLFFEGSGDLEVDSSSYGIGGSSNIYFSGNGDIDISAGSYGIHTKNGSVILNGSSRMDVYSSGAPAVYLQSAGTSLLLNGTGRPLKFMAENYMAVFNIADQSSPVGGANLSYYNNIDIYPDQTVYVYDRIDNAMRSITDVKAGEWYYNDVVFVYNNRLMNGTSDTTFEPNSRTTRAMIVTILYRLDGSPAVSGSSSFADVAAGMWYSDPIAWANKNGIVNGISDTSFAPNDYITREQMAAILYRYAKYMNYNVNLSKDISSFSDASSVSPYAVDAIKWAYFQGLINGTSSTTLSPKDGATRAQIAAILHRFCKM